MRLKVACFVYFELKNINRKKNFVKISSHLCNGFVMFFLIEDYDGKTNFVHFFRACHFPYPRYDIREYCFFQEKQTHISHIQIESTIKVLF